MTQALAGSVKEQRKHLNTTLAILKKTIQKLPAVLPIGDENGSIAQYFSDLAFETDEGPIRSIDQAYLRCFQGDGKSKNVTRGRLGMDLVYNFFRHFSNVPEMEEHRGLIWLEECVQRVLKIIKEVAPPGPLPATSFYGTKSSVKPPKQSTVSGPPAKATKQSQLDLGPPPAKRVKGSNGLTLKINPKASATSNDTSDKSSTAATSKGEKGKKRKKDSDNDSDDSFAPPPFNESEDSDIDEDSSPKAKPATTEKVTAPKGKQKTIDGRSTEQEKSFSTTQNARKRKDKKTAESGSSGEEVVSDSDVAIVTGKSGRKGDKAEWAFGHYKPSPAVKVGKPVWLWQCKWCDITRTSPRTAKCKKYTLEVLPRPASSNFISHMTKCKNLPSDEMFGVPKAARSTISMDVDEFPGENGSVITSQRKLMFDFTKRGRENPERQFTKKGFRESFVKAVIEDDLPFAFGEGKGMRKLFQYSTAQPVDLPSHQTVRRNLDLLHDAIDSEITAHVNSLPCRLAAASDLWTSRNTVYAFAGGVLFWISNGWTLEELVLDLIPVNGDHTGAGVGKKLFQSLLQHGVSKKITHVADNASSNNLVNRALAKRIRKAHGIQFHAENTRVGCAQHALHLVVQEIFGALGMTEPPDICDLYEDARSEPIIYDPSTDPEVLEQEEEAHASKHTRNEAQDTTMETTSLSDDEDESDSEKDSDHEESDEEGEGEGEEHSSTRKKSKTMSAYDKLHGIIVYIMKSDKRRVQMYELIQRLCEKDCVLIKGIKIRWNSAYAEMVRAILVKAAINYYIERLDAGLTGKPARAAKKKKQRHYLSNSDWELLQYLCEALQVFHEVTLDLSKAKEPSICKVLPLYKLVETHLVKLINDLELEDNLQQLRHGLQKGLIKLRKYIKQAFKSDFPLLGAVLHPSMRLRFFEDTTKWDADVPKRARVLLSHLYDVYSEEQVATSSSAPKSADQRPGASIFSQAMAANTAAGAAVTSELELYYSNLYPCKDHDALSWWKANEGNFPILSVIARDILAIPGVSISVERLFSSCKHTMTDARSSMTATTASKTVTTKEWLKKGWGKEADFLGTSVHN